MFAARSKSVEIFSNATLNLQFSKKKYFTAVTLEHFYTKLKNLFISCECTYSSVTREKTPKFLKKSPNNDFTRKMIYFDTFTKIA